MLGRACSRNHTEGRLELTKDRRLACRKAHVAGEYEFAADSANPTFDLGDGHEAARAYVPKNLTNGGISVELRCCLTILLDPGNVNVRNEIVRVSALEHDDMIRIVSLGSLNQRD